MSHGRGTALGNSGSELQTRFGNRLSRDGRVEPGDRVVVAFSGGVDSLVLLHLLRFKVGHLKLEVSAAHFDHRMRSGSDTDAQWAQGICRAWRVPLHAGRADVTPRSEEEAREARYAFFEAVRREEDARWVMTAHQADDQAETVLFRAVRGTGLKGLGGIPSVRNPGIYRPLLPFRRWEIEAYAMSQMLRAREDPTNQQTAYSRNFLRHRVLPDLEANVSPGATEALCRLGRLARENERAWRSLIPGLLEGVLEVDAEGMVVVRSRLLSYDPGVQGRLLREVLRRSGVRLDEAGTRVALEFTRTGASGRSLDLPGGYRLTRELDRFLLAAAADSEAGERVLAVAGPHAGSGEALVGGKTLAVCWGPEKPLGQDIIFEAAARDLVFPLSVRGWMSGDRIKLAHGTKKLKKLFLEARVPVRERFRIPVLSDSGGRVLWVGGLASSCLLRATPPDFFLGIRNVDEP